MTNSIGMKLVLIPPGEFEMGSPKELIEEELKAHADDGWYKDRLPGEGPQHRVRITKPFYLGVTEVTQEEYQRVMGSNPSEFSATGKGKDKVAGQDTKRFPVEQVSWDEAVEFCRKLSELPEEKAAGRWYRLPSEAQWEYACRAGSTGRYSFSSGRSGIPKEYEEQELSDYGWFSGNSGGRTHAVGGSSRTPWGLYDMHGNVWEWCQDWYDGGYYAKSPDDDPTGPPAGSGRVFRGGSWQYAARICRSAMPRQRRRPRYSEHDLRLPCRLRNPVGCRCRLAQQCQGRHGRARRQWHSGDRHRFGKGAAIDADRRAAEWATRVGGTVRDFPCRRRKRKSVAPPSCQTRPFRSFGSTSTPTRK